ncbi:unnamed protein product [Lactuca saligna]|uniref:Uncharacterized protein n=1 Tax=Lactuca saligna TaxID=75948 RepID=A0AA36DZP4_LACSI|nr:unnamed protein product [Lactuca saligna]
MMQEGGTCQTSVMQGSNTFGQLGSSIRWKLKSTNDETEQDNEVIDFIEGREENILPENIQLGLLDIDNMLEAGCSMAEIKAMAGVNDFIDDHHFDDDDVGLDGGVEGVGDEVVGHGDGDGEGNGVGDEVSCDSDEEGHGAGDVDDSDGPEGDGDGPEGGVDEMGDDEGNQGDDEGQEVIPMVRRIRKTSERITKTKLRNDVYDKYGGGSSYINTINLE